MLPHTQARKKRNSSKVNFFISFTFHAALALVVLYFAARQGWLGKQAQNISVELVKKEKPKEKPKEPEKPRKNRRRLKRPNQSRRPSRSRPSRRRHRWPRRPSRRPPPTCRRLIFDGGKSVISSSDPVEITRTRSIRLPLEMEPAGKHGR